MNIEFFTLKVLEHLYEAKGFRDFHFTKAEFIKAFYELRRQGKIPKIKIESVLRKLRDLASQGNTVRYADYRGGSYYCDSAGLAVKLRYFYSCYNSKSNQKH